MPSWHDVTNEVYSPERIHSVRSEYMTKLHEKTGRTVICYYSAFLSKGGPSLSIDDNDMNGFMNAVMDTDKTKGLDLLLHTPGGNPTATEAIVKYLRSIYGTDIRVIVPQLAMSAGTMLACAAKEIVMGKQSSLGPIDPQILGMAAFDIKRLFDDAKEDLKKDPGNYAFWRLQLEKFPPTLIYDSIKAIDLSSELVKKWLKTGMFKDEKKMDQKINTIVSMLNQNSKSMNHGRHFDKETCKSYGLRIVDLEDDDDLQDKVLSVHHAFMLLMNNTQTDKIIQNHIDKAYIYHTRNEAPTR